MSSESASSSRPPEEPRVLDRQPDAPVSPERCNVLLLSFVSLFAIGFGLWLVFAGTRYREEYAQATEGWQVGSTRMVEITLVKSDKGDLSCASDQEIGGLRCAYRSDQRPAGAFSGEDPKVLQPYNTVKNELLLGAGLWNSPDLKQELPNHRFTVVCNYHMQGVMRSLAIRFGAKGAFSRPGRTVTVGTLSDCVIPR